MSVHSPHTCQQIHATAIEINGIAVLLRGASGSGKSDLALRLIEEGARLIADDRVEINITGGQVYASSPANINGIMEVRGVGILKMGSTTDIPVGLLVQLVLGSEIERLPDPEYDQLLNQKIKVIKIDPFSVSATAKIRYVLKLIKGEMKSIELNDSQPMTENSSSETVVLVTGMSGAGKTTALKVLEDMAFEAIDNVPLSLLENLVLGGKQTVYTPRSPRPIAIGVDI